MNKPGYKRDPLLPTHNPKQNKRNIKTRYKYLKLTISNTYLNTCWCVWGGGSFKINYLKGGCSASLRGGDGVGSTQKVSLFPGVNYWLLVVMIEMV